MKDTGRPNGSPTETPTASQRWEPPRGIWYEFNRQRPATPFMLRWKEDDKPRSQSFSTEDDRETAAKALADKRQDFGKEILNFDPKEWRRWLEFKERINGEDLMNVFSGWQSWLASQGRSAGKPITVSDAVTAYIDFRKKEKLSPDTLRHFKKHLVDRFAATHGADKLSAITPKTITEWLDGIRWTRGNNSRKDPKPLEPVSKRHHRKDVNTFLAWCVSPQGWLSRNPCEAVPVPVVDEEDVSLMTLEEGQKLFAANKGKPVLGRLALEAFGFLRASSAGRIQKSQIKFKERGIRLLGPEHKSGKTKYRQGHPDNLWLFLEAATDDCWSMSPVEYRNRKHDAFVAAGIGDSENRLRRTCLSAHLAWQKNQPLTSLLAQHRHVSTTEIYLGVMEESDGKAWFQIQP